MHLFSSVPMTVAHIFMCCSSETKGKKSILKRHGNRWSTNITIDMKKLQALMFLYEGIIGGPGLPFVSNFIKASLHVK